MPGSFCIPLRGDTYSGGRGQGAVAAVGSGPAGGGSRSNAATDAGERGANQRSPRRKRLQWWQGDPRRCSSSASILSRLSECRRHARHCCQSLNAPADEATKGGARACSECGYPGSGAAQVQAPSAGLYSLFKPQGYNPRGPSCAFGGPFGWDNLQRRGRKDPLKI